jgi:F1F0 ATPase subunit 2
MNVIIPFATGLVLGTFCFGGLWWTVTRGVRSHNPALWLLLSAMGRLALVFAGIYLVARNGLADLLFCLIGFVVSRALVIRYLRAAQ